mgnify:CR=1 FL=1
MRWTNYFLHPGDNRYYVFTFREEEYAERFRLALEKDGIPFERNEKEFGVPRSHFNEALRHNHLLHAQIRKPFIENNGINVQMINESLVTILNYNEQKHDISESIDFEVWGVVTHTIHNHR